MLHFECRGSEQQTPILFLHGFMGSLADWEEVMRLLGDAFQAVLVDLPGHGASKGLVSPGDYTMDRTVEALVQVLDAADIERAHVVGYSMGGRLALHLALRHPDRCRKLVLESASPGLRTEQERRARRGVDEARALRLETGDFEEFLHEWYGQALFSSLARHDELVQRMLASRRRNDPGELARSLRGMGTGQQNSLWERLAALQVSTLAVTGALDGKYVEIAERMAVRSPKIRTATVPNCGHNVHAERPHQFVTLLRSFLRTSLNAP